MNFALVGTVMHDEIETVEGRRFESFGGILYNLMALSTVTTAADRLAPHGFVSAPHKELLQRQFFDRLPMVDSSRLQVNPAGTDHNVLRYVSHSSRREKMTVVSPPVTREHLPAMEQFDAVLFNFISGSEMDLDTFRWLRGATKGLVYLDVHNLGKLRRDGVPVPGHRFDGWADWFAAADIVQGNEWEAERLLGVHPKTEADFRDVALRFIAAEGPRITILTMGSAGAAMAWRSPEGIRYARIPAMPHLKVLDTTGCGDCFSAGFLVEYLRTGNPLLSALFAATLSGLNCAQIGLDGLTQITGVRETMESEYADLLQRVADGWQGELVNA